MTYELLRYLAIAEGTELHYNKGEVDITAPYGIYRKPFPNAKIFKYVDSVAKSLGIEAESKDWTKEEVHLVDKALDMEKINELAMEFYKGYTRGARLDMLPEEAQVAMFSLYTNSPKLAWKSVQSALNKFVQNGWLDYKIQAVDGAYGSTTKKGLEALDKIARSNSGYGYIFESYMLLEMSQQYAKLAVNNPDKYLKYLNGWNNRVEALAEF